MLRERVGISPPLPGRSSGRAKRWGGLSAAAPSLSVFTGPYLLLFLKCQISADDRGFDFVTVIRKCQFHAAVGLEAFVGGLPCKGIRLLFRNKLSGSVSFDFQGEFIQ